MCALTVSLSRETQHQGDAWNRRAAAAQLAGAQGEALLSARVWSVAVPTPWTGKQFMPKKYLCSAC